MKTSSSPFRFSVLSSGSKGNAVYIESAQCRILIDAGLGPRNLAGRMAMIERDMADLDAIFLTHEHSDHIRGIDSLTKKYKVPVYSTRGTWEGYSGNRSTHREWRSIEQEDEATLGDLKVESFATSHDAAESVAFVVRCGTRTLGHATDLGCVTPRVVEKLQGADTLLVESNYSDAMLQGGSYPWPLKQRISSDVGHLSNTACADLLKQVRHDGLRQVVLMHLSESNNAPHLAEQSARGSLEENISLMTARQDQSTPLLSVE